MDRRGKEDHNVRKREKKYLTHNHIDGNVPSQLRILGPSRPKWRAWCYSRQLRSKDIFYA